eukprot:m.185694 g.185694  ORF g.185694 m.185694 type:complete len:417 (-) comp24742_c0_seq2:1946-3196(-)
MQPIAMLVAGLSMLCSVGDGVAAAPTVEEPRAIAALRDRGSSDVTRAETRAAPTPTRTRTAAARAERSPFAITDRVYHSTTAGQAAVRSKVLTNTATGESAEVLWNWGGKVERVALRKPTTAEGRGFVVRDVIASRCGAAQSNCTAEDMQGNPSLGALLIPFANRVASGLYTFNGRTEQLSPTNDTVRHGFLIRGRPLRVVSTAATAASATVVLDVTFNGSDPGYPFVVDVTVTYTLDAAGFTVHVRGVNRMESSPAPFMVGCHPYFALQHSTFDTAKVELDRQCTQWNRAYQTLGQWPNGSSVTFHGFNGSDAVNDPHDGCPACGDPPIWDDGFTALAAPDDCSTLTVRVHDGDDTLLLDLDRSYRFVQIFNGIASAGIAVEPMSSATNAFNNEDGIIVLEAGQAWQGQFGFRLA